MRTFAWFLLLIVFALVVMGSAGYPVWLLLHPHFDFAFHRISSRLAMLALLVGFILISRRLGLADRGSLGYGLPRPQFLRELGVGLAIGVALMLPIIGIMVLLDLRMLRPDTVLDAPTIAKLTLRGLMSGLAVAFIEETFLRGAMFTGIQRESGTKAAVLITSFIYALTHFVGRFHIAPEDVSAHSGIDLLAGTFHALANPAAIADAFLCLFGVGVLLALIRSITGNIAACIGLHAGWVWIITFARETSERDPTARGAFLLSTFDGVVGWLVLAWTCLIGVALCAYYRRRSASRSLP